MRHVESVTCIRFKENGTDKYNRILEMSRISLKIEILNISDAFDLLLSNLVFLATDFDTSADRDAVSDSIKISFF